MVSEAEAIHSQVRASRPRRHQIHSCMSRNPKRAAPEGAAAKTIIWSSQSSAPRRAWQHAPLAPVNARPPFGEYLNQLWDRRHFIQMHAYSQALHAHQGTLLGRAWLIVAPLLDGLVYFLIFGIAFNLNSAVPDFVPRLIVGILLFSYFSRALTSTANSVNGGQGLIRAFSFPRASLPIAAMIREAYSAVPMLVALLVMIMILPPHARPTSTWLLLPFPLALISLFTAGLGFFLARVVSIVPDVSKLLSYALRFAMYGSGVIFSIDRFSDHPTVAAVLENNPLYIFIEMARELLLYATVPAPGTWLSLLAWAVVPLVLGLVYFWGGEANYGKQRVA